MNLALQDHQRVADAQQAVLRLAHLLLFSGFITITFA